MLPGEARSCNTFVLLRSLAHKQRLKLYFFGEARSCNTSVATVTRLRFSRCTSLTLVGSKATFARRRKTTF